MPPLDKEAATTGLLISPDPPRNVFLSVCSFIIVAEFCERLAYYGLTGSLTIFFKNNLHLDSALSTELSSAFVAFNYVSYYQHRKQILLSGCRI